MSLPEVSPVPAAGQCTYMRKRQGNNPKRRILPRNETSPDMLDRIIGGARYVGSAHHKRRPGDYGFHPPANPRPDKSLCDNSRAVRKNEAVALFREGVIRGMVSSHFLGDLPKYVWAVDSVGRAYEAKIGGADNREYHGYELEENEAHMRRLVLKEWQARCSAV